MYDITKKSSYDNLEKWVKELRENSDENITIMLVGAYLSNSGNKSDLTDQRAIKLEEASEYAARNKLLFLEISALLEDSSVDEAFRTLTQGNNAVTQRSSAGPGRGQARASWSPSCSRR